MKTSTITRRSRCLGLSWTKRFDAEGHPLWSRADDTPRFLGTVAQVVNQTVSAGAIDRLVCGDSFIAFRLFVGRRQVTQENWLRELEALVLSPGVVDRITLETED